MTPVDLLGYTALPSGFFEKKADGSGPYVFDGTTFYLVPTGVAARWDSSNNILTPDGVAHQILNSAGLLLPSIQQVQINSTNTSADTTEINLATFTIAPGVLQIGEQIEISNLVANNNSADTKNYIGRVNGTSIGSTTNTTNVQAQYVTRLRVHDANTLTYFNSFSGFTGPSASTPAPGSVTVIDLLINGFTFTLSGKWSAAANTSFILLSDASVTAMGRP